LKIDDKLCYCFHVSKRKILNHIRIHQPKVASQLSECGGAGTGCGWCVPFLKKCFDAEQGAAEDDTDITAEQYESERAAYIAAGKKRRS
jgi:NAD(P)H-nitrite reductase large subunit